MIHDTIFVTAAKGFRLSVERWLPDAEPTAVVHLIHGMAEHAARYEHVAKAFVDQGWAVYADDHRGHGKTAASPVNAGHFADHDGWEVILADQRALLEGEQQAHPGLPIVVVGHSLGSIIARDVATRWGSQLTALVLSGAPGSQGVLDLPARALAAQQAAKAPGKPSKILDRLAFGSYNKGFEQRTSFDWLSRDHTVVDAYVADPMCGFVCSGGFYRDMLGGLQRVTDPEVLAEIPEDLPILLASGGNDPVTDKGAATRKISLALADAGVRDITTAIFEGGRHEIFNEINRDEILAMVAAWIAQRLQS